jgi:membrane protein implicated in regulation of membrane protease activity
MSFYSASVNDFAVIGLEPTGRIIPLDKPRPGKKWRIHFNATDWFADSDQPITLKPGDIVRVIGQKSSTTLLIEPI